MPYVKDTPQHIAIHSSKLKRWMYYLKFSHETVVLKFSHKKVGVHFDATELDSAPPPTPTAQVQN